MDYDRWPRNTFEDRFAILASMMLRALARRRVRAQHRAGALFRPEHEGGSTPAEARERARWLELEAAYGKAYDGAHAALGWIRSAADLLRKIQAEHGGGARESKEG